MHRRRSQFRRNREAMLSMFIASRVTDSNCGDLIDLMDYFREGGRKSLLITFGPALVPQLVPHRKTVR